MTITYYCSLGPRCYLEDVILPKFFITGSLPKHTNCDIQLLTFWLVLWFPLYTYMHKISPLLKFEDLVTLLQEPNVAFKYIEQCTEDELAAFLALQTQGQYAYRPPVPELDDNGAPTPTPTLGTVVPVMEMGIVDSYQASGEGEVIQENAPQDQNVSTDPELYPTPEISNQVTVPDFVPAVEAETCEAEAQDTLDTHPSEVVQQESPVHAEDTQGPSEDNSDVAMDHAYCIGDNAGDGSSIDVTCEENPVTEDTHDDFVPADPVSDSSACIPADVSQNDADIPVTDTVVTDIPVTDTVVTDIPVTDTTVTDVAVIKTAATNLPVTETAVVDDSVTEADVTDIPDTKANVTDIPVTEADATDIPDTKADATDIPVTEADATDIPVTEADATDIPDTDALATDIPVTDALATDIPDTKADATDIPVTETDATENDPCTHPDSVPSPEGKVDKDEIIPDPESMEIIQNLDSGPDLVPRDNTAVDTIDSDTETPECEHCEESKPECEIPNSGLELDNNSCLDNTDAQTGLPGDCSVPGNAELQNFSQLSSEENQASSGIVETNKTCEEGGPPPETAKETTSVAHLQTELNIVYTQASRSSDSDNATLVTSNTVQDPEAVEDRTSGTEDDPE